MSKWQRHLYLNPEWERHQDGEIPLSELTRSVATKLAALTPFGDDDIDEERDRLVCEFTELAEDDALTIPYFDDAMEELYTWGDTPLDEEFGGKKVCWVDTFTDVRNAV